MRNTIIKIAFPALLLLALFSCKNQDFEFPDYDYTTGYFPYQYPVRTLVLGDDIYDNTNDNNHKFLISAAMGGVYANNKDRVFDIELAPELCSNVKFGSTNEAIHLMPQNYYTLSSSNQLTIPAGKVNGNIEVQLTDAFFDDPLAIKLGYVIPLRLVGSNDVDTVLQGKASVVNPDPRVAGDWETVPKNFTMFAVKYINPYHGTYFRRGSNVVKNSSGSVVENNIYRTQYVVQNEIWSMLTTGKEQVSVNSILNSVGLKGNLMMDLLFANDGSCIINQTNGSSILVSGTGKFVKDGDEWGDKKRNAIILSYNYSIAYMPPPPPSPVYVDNTDASITYTGAWTKYNDAPAYNGGTHYATAPSSFTFKFTGVAFALYFKIGSYGTFDVYLDDMSTPIATDVSAANPSVVYKVKLFEKTGLTDSEHTVMCVLKSTRNVPFDFYTYTEAAAVSLPAGTYTIEAKDTLVVRDRAVTMEVYNPVVSK